jgi:hypothetical protein
MVYEDNLEGNAIHLKIRFGRRMKQSKNDEVKLGSTRTKSNFMERPVQKNLGIFWHCFSTKEQKKFKTFKMKL